MNNKLPLCMERNKNKAGKRVSTFFVAVLSSITLMSVAQSANAEKATVKQALQPSHSVIMSDSGVKLANNGVYIVRFKDASLSSYTGGVSGLDATSPNKTGAQKIDMGNPDVKAYNNYLSQQRVNFNRALKRKIRRSADSVFDYRHVMNGVALKLSEAEARKVAAMANVASVQADTLHTLHTDSGPSFIGASEIWDGSATFDGIGGLGEGVVIGVIDTGINSDHPSFAAVGGDGHVHVNPLGSGNFTGRCGLPVNDVNYFAGCNDKLIGAHDFVDVVAPEEGNDGPEDQDGHGSHTASTSGGNFVDSIFDAPTISINLPISGVAPHANIIACDACYTSATGQGSCPGSATSACVDALIADGVDAINYSISGGNSPWSDSVSLGFLDATAAGIYVAASAGNSGPGAATVAHIEPWVSTTAASSHDNRSRANSLENFTGGASAQDDVSGLGITAGYGPAPIVYAGDFVNPNDPNGDPAQCLQPFPAGTFNGEIVLCDRGAIARVQKGQNALDGGAGGFVLANIAAQGEGTVADPHVLPGVHIGVSAGDELRAWLASGSGHMATITGTQPVSNPELGDIMAGFSSRGPGSTGNMIKPDITAPGSSIYAAVSDSDGPPPQFGTLSGTSMSSPHNAGSGALMTQLFPSWTPYEIKSAIMMTAVNDGIRKEDGVTPSDPFDRGAGRIDLTQAALTGLVMNETVTNMQDANPSTGGDPGTLNIASMQSDSCAGTCSWTRTVKSVSDSSITWSASGTASLGITVTPSSFTLAPGASQTMEITAGTAGAVDQSWNFGEVELIDQSGTHPDLSLPVAVFASNSTNPALIGKLVDLNEVTSGSTVRYGVSVSNISSTQNVTISDILPAQATYVADSATATVVDGTTTTPVAFDGGTNEVSWSGDLDGTALMLTAQPSPSGFVSLGAEGVTPAGCPSNCDDGAFLVDGLDFNYLGQNYTDAIWSINGTLELGTASGAAASAGNQQLPNPSGPNNVLAAFWTDMNLTDGGDWYNAILTVDGQDYYVVSWENIPRFQDPTQYSFQIWMEQGGSDFWFVYDQIPAIPAGNLTVGMEDAGANIGFNYYFDGSGTEPQVGTDLLGSAIAGGSVLVEFDAILAGAADELVTNTATVSGSNLSGSAIAVTGILPGMDTDGDGVDDANDNCTLVANADQRDTNGDGYGNMCDADLDNNGIVNFFDINIWATFFNTFDDGDADFNGDGMVNFFDYALVPGMFLMPPGPSGVAP